MTALLLSAVLLAGALSGCAETPLSSDPGERSYEHAEGTKGTPAPSSETEPSGLSSETEPSSETASSSEDQPSDSPSSEPSESEEPVFLGDPEILDSTWQYIEGYSWEDLYVILLETVRTSPLLFGSAPVFALFPLPYSRSPVLMTGRLGETAEDTELHFYTVDGGNAYELAVVREVPYYDAELKALYLADENAYLSYSPHVFLKYWLKGPAKEGLPRLRTRDLTGALITCEQIGDYIELPEGGAE